jgi:hypothetical protein
MVEHRAAGVNRKKEALRVAVCQVALRADLFWSIAERLALL